MNEYTHTDGYTPGGIRVPIDIIDDYPVSENDYGTVYTVPALTAETGLNYAAECIKEAIRHKRNCPVLVTGDPGIGKSTVILTLMQRINPDVTVDKTAFELDEFEHIFRENPYGNAEEGVFPMVNMDEAGHAMYGPEYLELEQRVLAKNLIVSRIKKEIVFFAVPKWKLLNPHIRNLMTIWIHVFEMDYYLQGTALLKFAPPKRQSEYQASKFWAPENVFRYGPLKNRLWEEYEARKVDFVNNCLSTDDDKSSLIKSIVHNLRSRGMTQEEIAAIIGRDRSRVSRYLSQRS
jgi:hypothetical protein